MEHASPDRQPQLHPGFRFHPTDEELVVHYLKRKVDSVPLPVSIIAEVDLYKFDPWELPRKAIFGEKEWYFFSPRDRKYPNGARPNRAAPSGYWKATGTDKAIVIATGARKIGVKKALVFYIGKPPKGTKTNWIMHEYRLIDGSGSSSSSKPSNGATTSKKASLRLDDWVLCRIYQKNNNQIKMAEEEREISMDTIRVPMAPSRMNGFLPIHPRSINSFGALLESEENFLEGFLTDNDNATTHVKADAAIVLASKQDFSLVSSYNWNDSKRFQGNSDGGGDGGGSNNGLEDMGHHHMGTVLESTAQNGSYKHNPVLGSLVEGVFRQPPYHMTGGNWNS